MIFEDYELFISSRPVELIKHYYRDFREEMEEASVLKMENGKYLFISFSGLSDPEEKDKGVIDHQEFENMEEAIKLFESLYGI